MRRLISIVVLTCVATTASATDRGRIRNLNIALQPVLTTLSAAVQGHLHTARDWRHCLLGGTAAGAIFYDAKKRAGSGAVFPAWMEANAAASLSANAVAGRNPLSRLRLTLGPARADVSTRFDSERNAAVHFSASIVEIGALGMMWYRSSSFAFRDGLIAFRNNRVYCDSEHCYDGYTVGTFSGTRWHSSPDTWPHEVVHSIQAVQADSLEPPLCFYRRSCAPAPKEWKPVRWDGFDFGALLAAGGLATMRQPYENRFNEIEAWRLAEDKPPRVFP